MGVGWHRRMCRGPSGLWCWRRPGKGRIPLRVGHRAKRSSKRDRTKTTPQPPTPQHNPRRLPLEVALEAVQARLRLLHYIGYLAGDRLAAPSQTAAAIHIMPPEPSTRFHACRHVTRARPPNSSHKTWRLRLRRIIATRPSMQYTLTLLPPEATAVPQARCT